MAKTIKKISEVLAKALPAGGEAPGTHYIVNWFEGDKQREKIFQTKADAIALGHFMRKMSCRIYEHKYGEAREILPLPWQRADYDGTEETEETDSVNE